MMKHDCFLIVASIVSLVCFVTAVLTQETAFVAFSGGVLGLAILIHNWMEDIE